MSKLVKTATLVIGQPYTIQCVFSGRSAVLFHFHSTFNVNFHAPIGPVDTQCPTQVQNAIKTLGYKVNQSINVFINRSNKEK